MKFTLSILLLACELLCAAEPKKALIKIGDWHQVSCTFEIIAPGDEENTGPWYISPEELISLGDAAAQPKGKSQVLDPVSPTILINGKVLKENPYIWVGGQFMAPESVITDHFNPDEWASDRSQRIKSGKYKCPVQPKKDSVVKKLPPSADQEGDDDPRDIVAGPRNNRAQDGAH